MSAKRSHIEVTISGAGAYCAKMTRIDKEKIRQYMKYQEENERIEENNLSSSHHLWW